MTTTKCEFHVYEIKKCGIYVNREPEKPKYLSIEKVIRELKIWAIDSDKPLIETSTYQASNSLPESFCFGMEEYSGNFLLALWNKVPHNKSGISKVSASSPVKKAKAGEVKIKGDEIAGYPSYFWILPKESLIIALKLDNRTLGLAQARYYIYNFINHYSSHVVNRMESGEELYGLGDTPAPTSGKDGRFPNPKLRGDFTIHAKRLPGKIDEILKNADNITKLIKNISVYSSLSDSSATTIESITKWFNNVEPVKKRDIKIEMPVDISEKEIQHFVDLWEENNYSDEYDVGFKFKGEQRVEWLSGANQKEERNIDVEWLGKEQANLEKLIKELHKHYHTFKKSKPQTNKAEEHEKGKTEVAQ